MISRSMTAYSVAVAAAPAFSPPAKSAGSENALRRVVLRAAGAKPLRPVSRARKSSRSAAGLRKTALWVAGDRALPPQICRWRSLRRPLRGAGCGVALASLAACRRRSALAAALSGVRAGGRHCHALRVRSLHSIAPASAIGAGSGLQPQARRAPPRRHASCAGKFSRGSARPHRQPRTAHVHPGSWRGVSARRAETTAQTNSQPTHAEVEFASLARIAIPLRAEAARGPKQNRILGWQHRRFDIHTGVAVSQGDPRAILAGLVRAHGSLRVHVRLCRSERTPIVLDSDGSRLAHPVWEAARDLISSREARRASTPRIWRGLSVRRAEPNAHPNYVRRRSARDSKQGGNRTPRACQRQPRVCRATTTIIKTVRTKITNRSLR